MFDALEEFSSSTDAELSILRDVRIVIFDEETISVFHEEFVRRYFYQKTSSATNLTDQGHPRQESIENYQNGNLGEGTYW